MGIATSSFGEARGRDLTGVPGGIGHKRFHGAGLAVAHGQFCVTCLKNGHTCPAREGSDECIFCEDKAPCPVMQRAATEHTQIPTSSAPKLIGEAQPTRGRYGEKLKKQPRVTVHADRPKEFVESPAGKELIRAAVKEVTMKDKAARTCSEPECGKALRSNNTSGRCSKHFYVPKNGKRRAGGKVKTKTQRKTAKAAVAHNDNGSRAAVSLVLTEQQIDDIFRVMTLDKKVRCLQAYFDEEI